MSTTSRALLALTSCALSALLAGCGGQAGTTIAGPTSRPSLTHGVGQLGSGFVDPTRPPLPEDTIHPSPGSWDAVHPRAGYRVALVVDAAPSHARAQTRVLQQAVRSWASTEEAHLQVFSARRPSGYVTTIQHAIDARPDLVISVGDGLVDPLAMVSAPNLETQFLILGAQIAEPTSNVTAANWHGAGFRGEGLGVPKGYDPESFTPERAGRALRAGVAAVLKGLTGIVVDVA